MRRQLRDAAVVSPDFHLRLPRRLDGLAGKVVLVYCDGVAVPPEVVKAIAPGAAAVVPLYATHNDFAFDVADAHVWWLAMVRMHLPAGAPSLHVWGPEDAHLSGSVYDDPFTFTGVAGEFVAHPRDMVRLVAQQANASVAVVLHMLQSKAPRGSDCAARRALFRATLGVFLAHDAVFSLVLITEHNRDSGEFDRGERPCLLAPAELEALVRGELAANARGHRVAAIRAVPGEGHAARNLLMAVERSDNCCAG